MNIDPFVANWVLEFFLRQPLEESELNSMLNTLPLPEENLNLQKLLLLKKLEFHISSGSVSESALDLFEQLEEIEFRQGNEAVSDTMKRAYCAVAVDCTLKPLKEDGDDSDRKFKFFETVKKIWRGKIGRMQKVVEKGGLVSELLWECKDTMEAAVWDDSASELIMKKFEGVNAVEAVRVYLREEREKLGPSFLELVAESAKNDESLQKVLCVDRIDGAAVEETPPSCVNAAADGSNASKEVHKGKIKLRDKLVGLRRLRGLTGNSRGAKIAESSETTKEPSCSSRGAKIAESSETTKEPSCSGSPCSVEVNRAREALELSKLELQAVVKDPLPDALRVAEAIPSEARHEERHNKRKDRAEGNDGTPKSFIVDVAGVVQSTSAIKKDVPKPSLMERNSTAHVYEWDDSVDESREDVGRTAVVHLPTPPRVTTSPLRIYEPNNLKKRRKGRRWSLLEEDTLRAGVEKYGVGCWKSILTAYQGVFEGRTDCDLKDKWRNLMRHS